MPETVVERAVSLVAGECCGGAEENGSEGVAVDVVEWRSGQGGDGSVVAGTGVAERGGKIVKEKACVRLSLLLLFCK